MHLLITGTSTGIGNYLAKNLWEKHSISWVSRRENTLKNIDFYRWDIRDNDFLEKISNEIKTLDFVILNAWVGHFWNFESITEVHHREILETNLLSPLLFTHKLLSKKKIKSGIIFIGSVAGKKSLKNGASYMASKFWLRGLVMGLKNDYKNLQIHIINPSIVKTDFHLNSNLDMSNYKENSLSDILKIIENIIAWKEKRFEVDV